MTRVNHAGKIIKIGNSLGIRIPKKFLDVAGIKEGDTIGVMINLDTKTAIIHSKSISK